MAGEQRRSGQKRPQNCFRCWHGRRVDGANDIAMCYVAVTKTNRVPELIVEPYRGICPSFWDKALEEIAAKDALAGE